MSSPLRPNRLLRDSAILAGVISAGIAPASAAFHRAPVTLSQDADPAGESGWCEIRLEADENATLKLHGREATLSNAKGSNCRIISVACSSAPAEGSFEFQVRKLDGPGRVELLWPPTHRNGWNATIRLYDATPDERNYGLRLEWRRESPSDMTPGQGGSASKSAGADEISDWKRLSYEGPGAGSYRLAGSPRAAIQAARWVAPGDGTINGTLTLETGSNLEFEGHVASVSRGQMLASVQAPGHPPGGNGRRGSLTVSRNRAGELRRLEIEGFEDGRRFSITFSP